MIESIDQPEYGPVIIGGVGGSGTRLIATLLHQLGFFMGSDLNEACDNLWFTFLFNRMEILSATDEKFHECLALLVNVMTVNNQLTDRQKELIRQLSSRSRKIHSIEWLKERAASLLSEHTRVHSHRKWGWKAPNSHIVIDRMQKALPGLKYIHVVRNGLDMAHSNNQNQLHLWGRVFMGKDCKISPFNSLRYWRIVHERIIKIGSGMRPRFLFLNFDRLCMNPAVEISKLLDFLDITATGDELTKLCDNVRVPASIGRYRKHGLSIFDPSDILFVEKLGFDTSL